MSKLFLSSLNFIRSWNWIFKELRFMYCLNRRDIYVISIGDLFDTFVQRLLFDNWMENKGSSQAYRSTRLYSQIVQKWWDTEQQGSPISTTLRYITSIREASARWTYRYGIWSRQRVAVKKANCVDIGISWNIAIVFKCSIFHHFIKNSNKILTGAIRQSITNA